MIEFMVNEAQNYSTPIERRALKNLENLRNYNEPTQTSTFSTLVDKPNHSYLETAFSDIVFQRAFLAVVPLLRKNCSCLNLQICKDREYNYELFFLLKDYVRASEADGTVARFKRLILKIEESVTWEDYLQLPSLL